MKPLFALNVIYIIVLIAVSYTDLRWGKVLNKIIYPAIVLALLAMFYSPGWRSALTGGLVGAVTFIVPIFFYGLERAGMGDVKLALFIGLILGFPKIIYAFLISFLAGIIIGFIGILMGRLNRKSTMPFAPFLALGAVVLLFVQV